MAAIQEKWDSFEREYPQFDFYFLFYSLFSFKKESKTKTKSKRNRKKIKKMQLSMTQERFGYIKQVKELGRDIKECLESCVSKVALNAYTRVLSKSFENLPNGQKVYINCMNPGFVKTDINNNTGTRTTEQGANTAVWLALLPPGGPVGQFFYERQVIQF